MGRKRHNHRVALCVRFNKAVTKQQAMAMVRDCIHADFFPDERMGAERFIVTGVKHTTDMDK